MKKFIIYLYVIGALGCHLGNIYPDFGFLPNNGTIQQITIPDTTDSLSDIFDFKACIYLDSTVSIGSISKILYKNNNIFIGDYKNTKDVYCYNKAGKLLWRCHLDKVESKANIDDFTIDPNTALLYVFKANAVYVYDQQGNRISEKYIDLGSGQVISKASVMNTGTFCVLYNNNETQGISSLILLNDAFEIISDSMLLPLHCAHTVSSIANLNQRIADQKLMYSTYFNDTIYSINTFGIQPEYCLKHHGPKNIGYKEQTFEQILAAADREGLSVGPDLVYETEHTLHFSMLKNGTYYSVYFDKKDNKCAVINKQSDDLLGDNFAHIPFGILPDDQYIFIIEPYLLHQHDSATYKMERFHPLLKEMYAKTNWSSNPILLIGKYKSSNL